MTTNPQPEWAISLKQPWAWAVLHAGKRIENRTWFSTKRGAIWIAASAQVTRGYYEYARLWLRQRGINVPELDELPAGAIVGSARVTGCILPGGFASDRYRDCTSARIAYQTHGRNWGAEYKPPLARHPLAGDPFHFPDQFGYVLDDVRALASPVACKGLQRWWRVKPELLAELGRVAA